MKNPFVKEKSSIDIEVERLIAVITAFSPETKEYTAAVANLKVLMEARAVKAKTSSVSPDMLVSVAGSIAGILLVLNYERLGIVTSKAFGMIFNKGPRS
jgi:hypothetical protein